MQSTTKVSRLDLLRGPEKRECWNLIHRSVNFQGFLGYQFKILSISQTSQLLVNSTDLGS